MSDLQLVDSPMDLLHRSLCCLVVCGLALGAALPPPNEGRREMETSQNEVMPPSNPTGRNRVSFSTLIKALYRLNTLGLPEEIELDGEYPSSQEEVSTNDELLLEPSEVTSPEDDYPWQPTSAPHLVDEVPDVLPLPIEVDKSHKFTHSFRFGYGAPV